MHKCNAVKSQVYVDSKLHMKRVNFNVIVGIWLSIVVLGNVLGNLSSYLMERPIKSFFEETGISKITGPKFYLDYLWVYVWGIKLVSSFYVKFGSSDYRNYKKSILPDIFITILFFLTYSVFGIVHNLTNKSFRISGHGLILTMTSAVLYLEGELNFSILRTKYIKYLCFGIIFVHFFIMFWTAFAFHTIFEALLGTSIGLFLDYLVYFKLSK